MASGLQLPSDDSVLLRVTHSNIKSFCADVRFSLEMSVDSVKEKMWKKCGTAVESMLLELYDDTGSKVGDLSDPMKPFGFYSPQDGYRLHIIDLDPSSVTSGGWLEDTSLVEKYTISEEAYNKLDDNFRKFKEKMASQHPVAKGNKVGDRCEVEPGEKRGVVKFIGKAEDLGPRFWVGIQYDEPLGKHDGMVKGKRYFDCPPQHGAMLRPDKVKVGDYPEREPFRRRDIVLEANFQHFPSPIYHLHFLPFVFSKGLLWLLKCSQSARLREVTDVSHEGYRSVTGSMANMAKIRYIY